MAEPEWPTEPCKSCGKSVIWCVTTSGRSMPVNAKPSADGNVMLYNRSGTGFPPLAEVLPVARQFGLQDKLRTSHFTTCPQAAKWRRPRRKAA